MRDIGNGNIRRFGAGVAYGTGANITQLQTWDLATDDDAVAVETAGYFNGLAAEMRVGDIINGRLNLGAAPALKQYIVTANDGAAVTVAAATA